MEDIKLATQEIGVTPKNLFLSLDLWCKDLVLKKEDKTVLDNGLPLSADEVFDFAQELGNIKLILQGIDWCYPKHLFLSLELWCKDLVPPKKDKTVLDNELPLCTDQVFDFVQEMGDIKLASQEAGVTQNISSLVLIFDAKTWSLKKRIKLFWTMDCLYVWLCASDGRDKADPSRCWCHLKKYLP